MIWNVILPPQYHKYIKYLSLLFILYIVISFGYFLYLTNGEIHTRTFIVFLAWILLLCYASLDLYRLFIFQEITDIK
jgi:hypothetical protein